VATATLGDEFDIVLGAARAGESWAFERLFHLVAQPLVGYFRAQGSPDPDGLANETLLRAFRGIARFEGPAVAFRAWVFSIGHCRLVDERRAAARRPLCGPLSAATDVIGDAEADAFDRLGDDWVHATLDTLAPDQRDVLLLRVVADLDIAQVAAALGKTPGAVKALQHRGLAALRRKLSAEAVSI